MPAPNSLAVGETPPPRLTLLQRLQITVISGIASAVVGLIGRTLRMTITYEEGSIGGLDRIAPGIYPFWHRCVLPATWLFRNQVSGC